MSWPEALVAIVAIVCGSLFLFVAVGVWIDRHDDSATAD